MRHLAHGWPVLIVPLVACAQLVEPLPPGVEAGHVEEPEDSDGWRVGTFPIDMTAGLGELLNPTVTVDEGVPEDVAEAAIRDRVRLVTWPEQAEVESGFRRVPSTAGGWMYEFRPDGDLEDRWYALYVGDMSDIGGFRNGSVVTHEPGARAARYRPGEDAVLRCIHAETHDGRVTLRLEFTRAIDDEREPIDLVSLSQLADCRSSSGGSRSDFAEVTCAASTGVAYVGAADDVRLTGGMTVRNPASAAPLRLVVPIPAEGRSLTVRPPYARSSL